MRVPYRTPPHTGLVVPTGASKTFAIPHPNRVRMLDIRVLQTAGTPVNFTVDLYSRSVPDSPSAGNADDIYLITPRGGIVQSAAGTLVYNFADEDKYFVNADSPTYVQAHGKDTPSLVDINYARKIYLRITNTGANDATFTVSLASEYLGGI